MRRNFKQTGYVALVAVLVVGAVATATAVALLANGTDAQRAGLVTQQSMQARNLASACAEEALQQINANTSFTGSNNLSLGQGTCTYTVTNPGGSARNISTTGTVGESIRKLTISVTIGSSISIVSWQETS